MKAFKSSKESSIQSTVFVIAGGRRGKPKEQQTKKRRKRRTLTLVFGSPSMKDETRTKIAFLRINKKTSYLNRAEKVEICKMFLYK
ncbi:unnamed protein product, partial [Ixodes pacificus]